MMQTPGKQFEKSFLSVSIAQQAESCDRYELAPLFLKLFKENFPVLEAGCGSGRWNYWLATKDIPSTGLDWSEKLCARARKEIPECSFVSGDMENLPFANNQFGGIIALGSIEHSIAGPIKALKEFHRVLKPAGIAVITIPYGGTLRRIMRSLQLPLNRIKQLLKNIIRLNFRGKSYNQILRETNKSWHPRITANKNGYSFYEYEFNKKQMKRFLEEAGFKITQEFVGFHNEGIYHNFGTIAGKWNKQKAAVDFNLFGKTLKKLFPVHLSGHMLCYIVTKK